MDILKKTLAPITSEAWGQIESEAKNIFETLLSARKMVRVSEPMGWDVAVIPTGQLEFPEEGKNKVSYGLRQVKPLIELRIHFELNIWELDNITRGALQIDLDPMNQAAKSLAKFEDETIFNGLKKTHISGMKESSDYDSLNYPQSEEDLPKTLAHGINMLQSASIEGPYTLLLGAEKWQNLTTYSQGYPLRRRIEEILEGSIIVSQNFKEALLVPSQTDDLLLTLGNDISIGYESHNSKKVKLFFTESFTFQVLDPSVIVVLR